MSMAPFGARPVSRRSERNRTRLALALAIVGIAAALLAYAVSPGVRHAVSHAAHSVKHAVGNVFDKDTKKPRAPAKHAKTAPKHGKALSQRTPAASPSSHTGSTAGGAHSSGP
jgi:hypothetical protein